MTGILENPPGVGHNQPDALAAEKENQHWERWAKKRTFVRALEGTYSHLYKQLVEQPRVFSSKDVPWKGGPGHYGKSVISPQAVNITQSIESHIEAYAPGASGQKHGHLNSAVFYVLKGRGHDVHDGRHIPWEGRRCDAGRERLRASALQRLQGRRGDPAGVQGEAAVPVHAPAVPENRGMAIQDPAEGRRELSAAE